MDFSDLLSGYEPYEALVGSVRTHNTPVSISGITSACIPHLSFQLNSQTGGNMLILTYSDTEARQIAMQLGQFGANAFYFPAKEYIFYNIETTNHQNEHERLAAVDALAHGSNIAVVASVEAAAGYTADRTLLDGYTFTAQTGGEYDTQELVKKLVAMGYVREDIAEGKGQFSLRGGILDIFPSNARMPVRIEFFGDEIDTIRTFDPYTQRSEENIASVRVAPAAETLFSDKTRSDIIAAIKKQLRCAAKSGIADEDAQRAAAELSADAENFSERVHFPAEDKYIPMIYKKLPTIFDYFSGDDTVMVIDSKRIKERAESLEREKSEMLFDLSKKGSLIAGMSGYWLGYSEMIKKINSKNAVVAEPFSHVRGDIQYKRLLEFSAKETPSFHGKIEYMYDDVKEYIARGVRVVILASNRGRGENITGVLNDKGIKAVYLHDSRTFADDAVTVLRGSLSHGFEYPDAGVAVISDKEIFDIKKRKPSRKAENTNRIKSFSDISEGDYVVHQSHGIGIYAGTQKITVNGVTKDYLKIKYRGTDLLYVPTDQLDMLYKYTKTSDREIKLNGLGGSEWSRTKQRVKKATGEMAKQLIALYSERERAQGFSFSPDTNWQREFEDTFLYQETEDQLRSIAEVKADMESRRPMDRLLCGDVGFGKTEVAIRAAFKAVADSKQVAYLCPTTVLAMQHYETFVKRMEKFPIKVEMLSRFRTPAQQAKILKGLKTGEIDIIIGTHKILGKDVKFKDLGLLVIDEEQRFGVAHKEKMKELKKNIDVLTMTATPIPRTLHMSMVNIRDMSVLAEPPENRYPVQTFVLEDNPEVIIDAMKNELSRGGQVYYLHNRVRGIYSTAEWIKSKIPEARVAVGHGQMKERELEDIMYDMVNGDTDILVCTTIIETGLDIPNANTIIIENADKMGLAQLYQLRGRVGRSNKIAYAYMTYRRDTVLTEEAEKRLRAVKEFTEFGSGFKIAMRDLEIRGAGNILGAEQHGHMDAVGYDMYCRLLRESVREAQGAASEEDIVVSVEIDADAFISEKYIPSSDQRIAMYKRIASIENDDDSYDIRDELIDRYGDIPRACDNIIEIACMKAQAKKAGICAVAQKGRTLKLTFAKGMLDAALVMELNRRIHSGIKLSSSEEPTVTMFISESKDPIAKIRSCIATVIECRDTVKQGGEA